MEILKTKIPNHIFDRLESAEIYTLDYFLLNSKQIICDKTRLTNRIVTNLINIVSEIISNHKCITAYDLKNLKNQWKTLKIGCPILDKAIEGIPTRGITEIYGESRSGKTQLGLQLSLQVQKLETYGGLNGGAIYICTEDKFPSKRLKQMSEFISKSTKENQDKLFSDNIFVAHIEDIEQLKYAVTIKIPVWLSKTIIKLVVIDSIAAVFRYNNEDADYIARTEDLRLIAIHLNKLSTQYNLAVVCINQVTSDPTIGEKPCLGLSWSNMIRKRIKINRSNTNILHANQIVPRRYMNVVFSPKTPTNQCSFVLTESGITGINK